MFEIICATIQHEDIRKKVMSRDTNSGETTTRVHHVKAMPRSENLNSGMSDYLMTGPCCCSASKAIDVGLSVDLLG